MKSLKITKAYLLAVCAILSGFLSACSGLKSNEGKPSEYVATGSLTYSSVSSVDYNTGGMRYKVFVSATGSIHVVNVTKDSLEVLKAKNP